MTLGPLGRNVVLARQDAAPQIVNDGVTIAKEIEVADPEVNIGVRLIQEVAKKSGACIVWIMWCGWVDWIGRGGLVGRLTHPIITVIGHPGPAT